MVLHARPSLSLCAVLVSALLASGNAAAHNPEVEKARALLADAKPAEAYALLEKQEFDLAGDVDFDTLLGVAALDAGKPDKATLAFERVLAVNPNAAGARLDMARAYFALGDFARARQELDVVAAHNPPPAARLVIDKYIAALDQQARAKRTVITGYVEGFGGYDDNVTSVVGDFTNAVLSTYNLAGFQPTGNAIKRSSSILGAAGGIDVAHRLTESVSFIGGADVRYRDVLSANNYSSGQLDLRGGASYASGPNVIRGTLFVQGYRQRTDVPTANRNTVGLSADWRRMVGEHDQASMFGVVARQRFPDVAVNDVDSATIGAGWLHLFSGPYKQVLYGSVLTGRDNADKLLANGSNNDKRSAAARIYAQASLSERHDLFASFGILYRADRSKNARSTVIDYGNDHTSDATIGLNWRVAPHWTIRPQVTYSINSSNIALSEYHRTETTVTARYDFQ